MPTGGSSRMLRQKWRQRPRAYAVLGDDLGLMRVSLESRGSCNALNFCAPLSKATALLHPRALRSLTDAPKLTVGRKSARTPKLHRGKSPHQDKRA
jgi:hypothetical protein